MFALLITELTNGDDTTDPAYWDSGSSDFALSGDSIKNVHCVVLSIVHSDGDTLVVILVELN